MNLGILRHEARPSAKVSRLTFYDVDFTAIRKSLPDLIDREAGPDYFEQWDAFLRQCERKQTPAKRDRGHEAEAAYLFDRLTKIYNERIEVYNEENKDKGRKPQTRLARSPQRLEKLYRLTEAQGLSAVEDAFRAYSDYLISNGNGRLSRPIDYFLKQESDTWPIFEEYLNIYNSNYTFVE